MDAVEFVVSCSIKPDHLDRIFLLPDLRWEIKGTHTRPDRYAGISTEFSRALLV